MDPRDPVLRPDQIALLMAHRRPVYIDTGLVIHGHLPNRANVLPEPKTIYQQAFEKIDKENVIPFNVDKWNNKLTPAQKKIIPLLIKPEDVPEGLYEYLDEKLPKYPDMAMSAANILTSIKNGFLGNMVFENIENTTALLFWLSLPKDTTTFKPNDLCMYLAAQLKSTIVVFQKTRMLLKESKDVDDVAMYVPRYTEQEMDWILAILLTLKAMCKIGGNDGWSEAMRQFVYCTNLESGPRVFFYCMVNWTACRIFMERFNTIYDLESVYKNIVYRLHNHLVQIYTHKPASRIVGRRDAYWPISSVVISYIFGLAHSKDDYNARRIVTNKKTTLASRQIEQISKNTADLRGSVLDEFEDFWSLDVDELKKILRGVEDVTVLFPYATEAQHMDKYFANILTGGAVYCSVWGNFMHLVSEGVKSRVKRFFTDEDERSIGVVQELFNFLHNKPTIRMFIRHFSDVWDKKMPKMFYEVPLKVHEWFNFPNFQTPLWPKSVTKLKTSPCTMYNLSWLYTWLDYYKKGKQRVPRPIVVEEMTEATEPRGIDEIDDDETVMSGEFDLRNINLPDVTSAVMPALLTSVVDIPRPKPAPILRAPTPPPPITLPRAMTPLSNSPHTPVLPPVSPRLAPKTPTPPLRSPTPRQSTDLLLASQGQEASLSPLTPSPPHFDVAPAPAQTTMSPPPAMPVMAVPGVRSLSRTPSLSGFSPDQSAYSPSAPAYQSPPLPVFRPPPYQEYVWPPSTASQMSSNFFTPEHPETSIPPSLPSWKPSSPSLSSSPSPSASASPSPRSSRRSSILSSNLMNNYNRISVRKRMSSIDQPGEFLQGEGKRQMTLFNRNTSNPSIPNEILNDVFEFRYNGIPEQEAVVFRNRAIEVGLL